MKKVTFLIFSACFINTSYSQTIKSVKFDYQMYLQVDYKKRESYLIKTGTKPSAYEKAFVGINKSFHAANISDKVDTSDNQYVINSKGELVGALHYALFQQRLIRSSSGQFDRNSWVTKEYKEKRGNTDQLITRFDPKTNKVNFIRGNQFKSSSAYIPSVDVLSIAYQFLNRELPSKEFKMSVTDGKSIKQYSMRRGETQIINFQGKPTESTRFYKAVTKDDPTSLEIWYSNKDKWPLKYVIGFKDQYGATIKADLVKVSQ